MLYNNKKLYSEKMSDSVRYREVYASSVDRYIKNMRTKAGKIRSEYISRKIEQRPLTPPPRLLCSPGIR